MKKSGGLPLICRKLYIFVNPGGNQAVVLWESFSLAPRKKQFEELPLKELTLKTNLDEKNFFGFCAFCGYGKYSVSTIVTVWIGD